MRVILIQILIFFSFTLISNNIKKAFEALKIYDYFKARTLLYKELRKNIAPASFGLATIYSRNDNPFTNADSASKYAHLGYNAYKTQGLPLLLSGFKIDSAAFISLCDSLAINSFEKIKKTGSIYLIEKFLCSNYLAHQNILNDAIDMRDEIEFNTCIKANKSDSTMQFIKLHPQSNKLSQALLLYDRQLFEELTKLHAATEYISFISKYPKNRMLNNAYDLLYNLYRGNSDAKGIKQFIDNYPNSPQITEAWKQYFALTVKSFSNSELEKFLSENPKFPFKNSILKELELNKLLLYPYEKDEVFGFIDSTGKIVITPEYDEVMGYNESLSVVSKNDSVFFVNKENVNVFNNYYNDAFSFYKGIAAVKKDTKWALINRQGQTIELYDEINELSNNAYVFKLNNKYGALNAFGKVIVEARYDKMGDFKNEFAYYIENNKYGFISKTGAVHKAEFDWISDFNENNLAVFKKNNNYGIINSDGKNILEAEYEQIFKAKNNIYIVVKNSMYGFFHGSSCWLTAINYDYLKEKSPEFYTNGIALKLIKKDGRAIMDLNGKIHIDFGAYDEVNFACNFLIRVKKKNKYGFLDRKLTTVIPIKFDEASDFTDSISIVRIKEKNLIINTQGKELFSTEGEIKKITAKYYLAESEQNDLINRKGEKIFTNIKNVQRPNNSLLVITLSNNEIKLLFD